MLLLGAPLSEPHWLQANICRRRLEKRLKRVSIDAQQLGIALDEPFLTALVGFGARCQTSAAAGGGAADPKSAARRLTPSVALVRAAAADPKVTPARRKRPYYIDKLRLLPLQLMLTYRKGPDARATHAAHSALNGTWRPPPLPSVSELSLQLRAYELEQSFFERRRLSKALKKHYTHEARRQMTRILLHTDVAGLAADSLVHEKVRGVFSSVTGLGRKHHAAAGAAAEGGGSKSDALRGPLAAAAIAAAAGSRRAAEGSGGLGAALGAGTGRMRLARGLLGPARAVSRYDEVEAIGWHCLHAVAELAEHSSEPYLCCVQSVDASSVLVLTDGRLACLAVSKAPPQLLWQTTLRELVAVDDVRDDGALSAPALRLVTTTAIATAVGASLGETTLVRAVDEATTRTLQRALRSQLELLATGVTRLPSESRGGE